MSTVTGRVRRLSVLASPGAQLRWKYVPTGAVVGGQLVDSMPDVTTPSDSLGRFSQALAGGDYILTIDGNTRDQWAVPVPNDNLEYDIDELLMGLSDVEVAAVPNATSTQPGLVLANSNPSPGPMVVYSKAEVDAAIAAAVAAAGGFSVATIAAAQALTRAQMAAARLVTVLGGLAAYDGLGGGLFHFNSAGTNADDGIRYLRPVDYSVNGVLSKVI